MPRKAEFIFPPKRCEWPILSSLTIHEAFFEVPYSDIPETDAAFWADAEFRMPPAKQGVYVQLDQDILTWLKGQGPHYQTRINTILRAYMEADRPSS